jgi:hypothetical protein
VEYCASVGIVEGYEDGNFYPNRNVTATQWLKMLVAALRYDKNKLNGKDWAKYTYDAAIGYGVITADEFKLDFDRETAILYAFNALTSTAWEKESMAEHQFKLQEKIVYDAFARPTERQILSNSKVVTTFKIDNDGVKNTTATVAAGADYYEDGVKQETTGTKLGGYSATVYTYDNYAYSADAAKAHDYVYGEEYGKTVVVKNTYVEKLTTDALTKEFVKLNDSLKKGDVVTYEKGNDKYYTASDASKGEIKLNAKLATSAVGKVSTAYRDAKDVTKNYVKIDDGAATYFAAKSGLTTLKTAEKYTLYYDDYKNIVYAEKYVAPARETTLVFATKVSATAVPEVTAGEGVEYNVTYKLQYMDLTDGSLKTATVALGENGAAPANLPGDLGIEDAVEDALEDEDNTLTYPTFADAANVEKYYEIAANEDGTIDVIGAYTLDGGEGTRTAAAVTQNKAEFTLNDYTKGLANKNTTLTVISYKDRYEKASYVTVTGYQNFTTATYSLENTYTTAVVGADGYATQIYVIAPVAKPDTSVVFAMYLGKFEDSSESGQAYRFIGSDGETFDLTYAQAEGLVTEVDGENLADANDKLEKWDVGTVVRLTKQNGEFTKVVKATKTATGKLTRRDEEENNVRLDASTTVNYYAASFGGKFISTSTTHEVAVPTVAYTDANGLDVPGSQVTLYLNAKDEIVFATVDPAAKAE